MVSSNNKILKLYVMNMNTYKHMNRQHIAKNLWLKAQLMVAYIMNVTKQYFAQLSHQMKKGAS